MGKVKFLTTTDVAKALNVPERMVRSLCLKYLGFIGLFLQGYCCSSGTFSCTGCPSYIVRAKAQMVNYSGSGLRA
jgi:hypothetical protein